MLDIVVPDSGIGKVGTVALNPDTYKSTVMMKVHNYNNEHPDAMIDPSWAYDHPYEADKLLNKKRKVCK